MSNNKNTPQLTTTHTIQQIIGGSALLFPAVLIVLSLGSGWCTTIQETISHYYYTIVGNVFVGILTTISILLIIYKGYPNTRDFLITTLAGAGGIGVAMFPTTPPCDTTRCIVVQLEALDVSTIHYLSALLMFGSLAVMCMVQFTKKSAAPTKAKLKRNKLYIANGILIIVSILSIFLIQQLASDVFLCESSIVLYLEWFALINFGCSWMVKGGLFLTD